MTNQRSATKPPADEFEPVRYGPKPARLPSPGYGVRGGYPDNDGGVSALVYSETGLAAQMGLGWYDPGDETEWFGETWKRLRWRSGNGVLCPRQLVGKRCFVGDSRHHPGNPGPCICQRYFWLRWHVSKWQSLDSGKFYQTWETYNFPTDESLREFTSLVGECDKLGVEVRVTDGRWDRSCTAIVMGKGRPSKDWLSTGETAIRTGVRA